MKRTKEEIELLKELGYDPDDPAYTVENFGGDGNAGVPVTATETDERTEYTDELRLLLEVAIDALQRALKIMK